MKPEYKYNKRKNIITKDGHTMFLSDAVNDLNGLQRTIKELESAWQVKTLQRKDQLIGKQERENDRSRRALESHRQVIKNIVFAHETNIFKLTTGLLYEIDILADGDDG